MEWYWILLICVASLVVWLFLSAVFYRQFFKRFYDIVLSFVAILLLSPVLAVLIVAGAIAMKGNPFFVQERPGKREKIFRLVKFRTMTGETDAEGNLLPDGERLSGYGKFLRATSLDELPELFNIFAGQMSIVGPRPLLVRYLDRYSDEQRHRHDVRPGLTGYAQCHGRNAVSWSEKFEMDVLYTRNISLWGDIKIVLLTVVSVFRREGISSGTSSTMEEFMGNN